LFLQSVKKVIFVISNMGNVISVISNPCHLKECWFCDEETKQCPNAERNFFEITLSPVQYVSEDPSTHFQNLLKMEKYKDALFILNSDEKAWSEKDFDPVGTGTSVFRPKQHGVRPRCFGIPTGLNASTPYTEETFDDSLYSEDKDGVYHKWCRFLQALLLSGYYNKVVYSCGSDGRSLGSGRFDIPEYVSNYIIRKIETIIARDAENPFTGFSMGGRNDCPKHGRKRCT
jgi:hypothetical protein